MSLDARVYCDCHERGRLRQPPPHPIAIFVEPNGDLGFGHYEYSLEVTLAWDRWRETEACEHLGGVLIHHRLGSIGLIALLRSELQREAGRFPILLTNVIYNGMHGGDFLDVKLVAPVKTEVEALAHFKASNAEAADYLSHFRSQMGELLEASLRVNKPIAF